MSAEGRHVTTVAVVNRVVEHYVPVGGYIVDDSTGDVVFRQKGAPSSIDEADPRAEAEREDAPVADEKPKSAPQQRKRKKK